MSPTLETPRSTDGLDSALLRECIAAAGPAWQRYERHPWFAALESGELSLAQFVRFQTEDAPFLPFVHQVMALALAKAPTGSPWSRGAARMLNEVFIANEMKAKAELLADLGVEEVRFDRWALSPRREGYAHHLLRVAHEGTAPEIAAALTPCNLFTHVVGRRFENVDIQGPPPFKRWAKVYSDKQMYEMVALDLMLMEDGARQSPAIRDEMVRLFVRSTQHQVAVFDDALEPGPAWTAVSHQDLRWPA